MNDGRNDDDDCDHPPGSSSVLIVGQTDPHVSLRSLDVGAVSCLRLVPPPSTAFAFLSDFRFNVAELVAYLSLFFLQSCESFYGCC